MPQKSFSGIITAVATPFLAGKAIDYKCFSDLLTEQKAAGLQGVVVSGTTGESPTLTDEERLTLVQKALEYRSENFHIYVGVGCNDTAKTVENCKKMLTNTNGIAGLMAVVPYYNKPSQKGLFEHFSAIAAAIGNCPLCVYNVPGRTCSTLAPQTFIDLVERHDNIVALKEASGDLHAISAVRNALDLKQKVDVRILSGDDPSFVSALLSGAEGAISVSSHIIPWAMLEILDSFQKNDAKKLQKLLLMTRNFHASLFLSANPVPLKWILNYLGFGDGSLRLPLVPLEHPLQDQIRDILQQTQNQGIRLLKRSQL